MSGLFDAIGRGISAAANHASDIWARQSVLEKQGEAEMERLQRLEEFKANLAEKTEARKLAAEDTKRTEMATRIDTKAGELADDKLAPTRGLIDAGITDRGAWTPEHQASVDQAMGIRRKSMKADLRTEAAIATGDISPKDAATIEDKDAAAAYKLMLEDRKDAREEAREDRRDARRAADAADQDRRQTERLEALAARMGGKGGDTNAKMLDIVENERKELDSRSRELRQLQKEAMSTAIGPTAKRAVEEKFKPQFDELDRQRKEAQQDYDFLREKIGMPKRGAKTPTSGVEVDMGKLTNIVMQTESGGRRFGADGKLLRSPKGAGGEMQVMDATNGEPGYGVAPARDASPDERARVGKDYLAAMVKEFNGDLPKALAAYNYGPPRVKAAVEEHGENWLAKMPAETRDYVAKNMAAYQGGEQARPPNPDRLPASSGGLTRVSSDAEYARLPSGAQYIAPDGTTRRKR